VKHQKISHLTWVPLGRKPGTELANVPDANKLYNNHRVYGILSNIMKISQKGLYALQAMMMLSRHYNQGAIRIRDIAYEEALPEKFLELILLELKNARMVESVRGAKGGYQLRRAPSDIHLSEIIRLIDGPLAPFGDADQLRTLISRDDEHRALYQVFLAVRDAAAKILEHTTLADIVHGKGAEGSRSGKSRKKKSESSSVLPMVVHGNPSRGKDE
jgi:Rrf2 family transcriptional regulator, cysteine metabolism repressor